MAVKFIPEKRYKTDKDGNKVEIDPYKSTDFRDIVNFLTEKGTKEDRKEFKKNCYLIIKKVPTGRKDKKGKEIMEIVKDANGNPVMEKTEKPNWLYAKRKFFEKYAPEYLGQNKRENLAELIKDW